MRINNEELKLISLSSKHAINYYGHFIDDYDWLIIQELALNLLEEREKMQKLLYCQKENIPAELLLTCPSCLREKNIPTELYITHHVTENSYQTIRVKCFSCVYHNTHVYKIK